MTENTIIGVDLAKNVFQLHGAAADGTVIFRKKLSRPQFHRFMAHQPRSIVVMEACGGAHYWARALTALGHSVKLISPHYVKPFVKRQKNDAADAEAIVEAALRPSMRFVEPKSEAQQASAVLFRFREKLVKQRTELINAIRSYLFEFGHVIPKGPRHLRRAAELVADETEPLPDEIREICRDMLDEIGRKTRRIDEALKQINAKSREQEALKRLQTMPGLGPITAATTQDVCTADGDVPSGKGLRRLAGFGSEAELDRRETAPGSNVEDGTARHSPIADHRRHVRSQLGLSRTRQIDWLAGLHAGPQTANGRRRRAGQQDGEGDLGNVRQSGSLSIAGNGVRPVRKSTRKGKLQGM